jgi:hypothetical protein
MCSTNGFPECCTVGLSCHTANAVARNMPGAGSFQAATHVYSVAPQDGTVLAIGAPTLALEQKMGVQGVRFDTTQLNWIGRVHHRHSMACDTPVLDLVHRSGADWIDDDRT